jgi:hypothetical protein
MSREHHGRTEGYLGLEIAHRAASEAHHLFRLHSRGIPLTVRAHLPCGRMNRRTRMDDSTSEWLTYEQAAERLYVSPAAVRARAMRGGWRRQPGNDGKSNRRCCACGH